MKRNIIILIVLQLASFFYVAHAQKYKEMMNDPNANFYDIQKEFYKYWEKKEKEIKKEFKDIDKMKEGEEEFEGEYFQFKRWEWFMGPRVYPSGKLINPAAKAFEEWQLEANGGYGNSMNSTGGTWSPIGPYNYTLGDTGYAGGIGRINCIAYDPSNVSTIYVGTPVGGIWKTTTGGNNWTPLSDGIPVLGVSGIAVNPTVTSHLYILTGDGDGAYSSCIGVMRSMNGGSTWSPTSLTFPSDSLVKGYKLVISPADTALQFAATSKGIYRTTNSWVTNSLVVTGDFTDIEFKPDTPATVYACTRDKFYKSTNSGAGFSQITSGLPASGSNRIAIGVTPNSNATVYLVYGTSFGLIGVYKSTDSGTNFTVKSTSPNILGYDTLGNDNSSTSYWNLNIGVDPTNAATVYVGSIAIWKSTNSGVSWTAKTSWKESPNYAYNHCDLHAFEFIGSVIYTGSDGGIYKSTNGATSFTQLSNTLQITQIYRMEGTPQNSNLYFYGAQDNGTSLFNSSSNSNVQVYGSDGGQSRIDYTNSNNVYYEFYEGGLMKSTDGGAHVRNFKPPGSGTGAWITPFIMNPVDPLVFYAGYNNIYKTLDTGNTWLNVLSGAVKQQTMAIGRNDTGIVYSASTTVLRKTINGGANWTNITGTLPVASAEITRVACSSIDANKVWVTFSGYSAGNKVFYSANGGTSWTNISGGLPNIPVNCIGFQPGSPNDGVYVGTDLGIYYRDNDLGTWIPYKDGLPNTIVFDFYMLTDENKITAGTFGRGVWVSDLYSYCPVDLSLTQANSPGSGGFQRYQCSHDITSSRIYTGGAGADVKYNAGNSITFTTGFNFKSDNGAQFTAFTSGCPVPSPGPLALTGTYEGNAVPWAANTSDRENAIAPKENNEIREGVKIYPNPAATNLNVAFDYPVAKLFSLEITNSYGQVVEYREASALKGTSLNAEGNRKLVIPVETYSSGIYFVRLKGEGISEIKKFSVIR